MIGLALMAIAGAGVVAEQTKQRWYEMRDISVVRQNWEKSRIPDGKKYILGENLFGEQILFCDHELLGPTGVNAYGCNAENTKKNLERLGDTKSYYIKSKNIRYPHPTVYADKETDQRMVLYGDCIFLDASTFKPVRYEDEYLKKLEAGKIKRKIPDLRKITILEEVFYEKTNGKRHLWEMECAPVRMNKDNQESFYPYEMIYGLRNEIGSNYTNNYNTWKSLVEHYPGTEFSSSTPFYDIDLSVEENEVDYEEFKRKCMDHFDDEFTLYKDNLRYGGIYPDRRYNLLYWPETKKEENNARKRRNNKKNRIFNKKGN